MTNKRKIINDPVFGFITIPSEFIFDLLQHPWLNRLSRIKQLGLTHYVYPGTQHNRLQHSLGAMYLMTEAVKALQSKGVEITDEEAEAVYAAILLHDIGHGPFSHALEGFFFENIPHEEVGLRVIERLNREFGGRLSLTLDILRGHCSKPYLHELVSGQLDMDRLDYLRRDSFFSGVSEGNIGSARIIKMLNVKDDHLVVDAKGIYSIENFLMSRRLMYWQVYLHKTTLAADVMLRKTMLRARLGAGESAALCGSTALAGFIGAALTQVTDDALDAFLQLDDSDIWVALKAWRHSSDPILALLADGIVNRRIFRVQVSGTPFPASLVEERMAGIETTLRVSREDREFLYALQTRANHLYDDNDTGINILYSDGSTRNIAEASDMFNINLLAHKNTKYYFCYYRLPE